MYVGSDDSVNVDDEIEVDTFDSDVKFACSFRIIRCRPGVRQSAERL